ncbi:unnamed protein product [Lampetra planeri]
MGNSEGNVCSFGYGTDAETRERRARCPRRLPRLRAAAHEGNGSSKGGGDLARAIIQQAVKDAAGKLEVIALQQQTKRRSQQRTQRPGI